MVFEILREEATVKGDVFPLSLPIPPLTSPLLCTGNNARSGNERYVIKEPHQSGFSLVHIIPFVGIRQNAGDTRYRCEGALFPPSLLKAYWDRIEILDEYGEKLLHSCPRLYLQSAKEIDWASELEIFIRRPRAVERAVCLKALPDCIKDYFLSAEDLKERRQRIKAMVDVLRDRKSVV